jgi:hypothetical protein
MLFTDEWGGGQPCCRETDPMHWGAPMPIFTLEKRQADAGILLQDAGSADEERELRGHNGSLIPIPGRDILVQGMIPGDIPVVDITDASHPFEIAFFDRGPVDSTWIMHRMRPHTAFDGASPTC